ncbi:MAG: hypothetical protein M1839_001104 [Geoglossum umbratile]|nr:MAG: hypothetical protein M1839_001104 [Geoglossum umbratile]
MKTLSLIPFFLSLCPAILSAPNFSAPDFEKRFLSHYPTNNTNSIRLIGYKKIYVPADEITEFEGHWNSEEAWSGRYSNLYNYFSHVFYDSSEKAIRLYFPVEGALLEHDGGIIEADELGQLPPHVDTVKGPCKVVGRKKTHHVHGVDGNVIKDGIIYLAEANAPIRQHGNAYVYDFGTKSLHEHDHHHDHSKGRRETPEEGENADQSATQPNKGCVANHGGINCSKRYGYNQGRCPFNPNTCMDYNGYFTDCVKGTNEGMGIPSMGKTVKFIGSDCSVSVSDGHCWNEL